jgi:uncharacterized protein YjbI with pentapeptide repeats
VDFSDHDFSSTGPNYFENFEFGDHADFSRAVFPSGSSFTGAKFGRSCKFVGTRWGDSSTFCKAVFGENAHFDGAQFGGATLFDEAEFINDTYFIGAQFGGATQFLCAKFHGYVNFSALDWDRVKQLTGWTDTQFLEAKNFSSGRGIAPDNFDQIDFRGAQFLGVPASNGESSVDFSNRIFLGKTEFTLCDDKPIKFYSVPKFHGCKIHQDTNFTLENKDFPEATGNDKTARAYRTLKLAFSEHHAIREEQFFFRLEMEEETLRETGLKRWLFQGYKTLSDYGFSFTRPLKYGILGVLVLTAVYGLLSVAGQCTFSGNACHFAPQWLEFSLLQTLPLPGLDNLSEAASKTFWPQGASWKLGLSALVIVHKTISLAALFLMGLALRNLFKLK